MSLCPSYKKSSAFNPPKSYTCDYAIYADDTCINFNNINDIPAKLKLYDKQTKNITSKSNGKS